MKTLFVILSLAQLQLSIAQPIATKFKWANDVTPSNNGYESGTMLDIAVDENEYTYVVGYEGIDSSGLTYGYSSRAYPIIIKHSSEGHKVWEIKSSTPVAAESFGNLHAAHKIATNGSFVAVLGEHNGTINWTDNYGQSITISRATTRGSQYIALFDVFGHLLWLVDIYNNNAIPPVANISLDLLGNVYIGGNIRQNNIVTFNDVQGNGVTLSSTNGSEFFIIKYTSQGTLAWNYKNSTPGISMVTSLDFDLAGNIWAGGTVSIYGTNPFHIGNDTFPADTTASNQQIFISKFNSVTGTPIKSFIDGWLPAAGINGGLTGINIAIYGPDNTTGYTHVTIGSEASVSNNNNLVLRGDGLNPLLISNSGFIASYVHLPNGSGNDIFHLVYANKFANSVIVPNISIDKQSGVTQAVSISYGTSHTLESLSGNITLQHSSQPYTAINAGYDLLGNILNAKAFSNTGANPYMINDQIAVANFGYSVYFCGAFIGSNYFSSTLLNASNNLEFRNGFVAKLGAIPEKADTSGLCPGCKHGSISKVYNESIIIDAFPNPANKIMTIAIQNAQGDYPVNIIGINGNHIETLSSNGSKELFVNTENYPEGVYLITYRKNDAIQSKRILILH